jgi:Protein of unknown function (DUF3667)
METTCKNCGAHSNQTFCGSCGQKMHVHRFDTKHILLHEIPHSILHLDKGFLLTTKALIKRPGHFIREYIEGKRANHYGPIQYVFIIGIVLGFIFSFIDYEKIMSTVPNSINTKIQIKAIEKDKNLSQQEIIKQKLIMERTIKLQQSIQHFVKSQYKWIIFFLIPFSALAGLFITKKIHYNYAENLVRALYTTGIGGFYNVLFSPLSFFPVSFIWQQSIQAIISFIIPTIIWNQFLSVSVPSLKKRIFKIILYWIYFAIGVLILLGIFTFLLFTLMKKNII